MALVRKKRWKNDAKGCLKNTFEFYLKTSLLLVFVLLHNVSTHIISCEWTKEIKKKILLNVRLF